MSDPSPRPFIESLVARFHAQDRAAMARLSRGLRRQPGEAREVLRYVVPFLPAKGGYEREYFLIAGLFGLHPCAGGEPMGRVFSRMSEGRQDSTERRFEALLASHRDDLPFHLTAAVRLAKSSECRIDYEQLLRDLSLWDHPDRVVQLRWAKQYWRGPAQPTPTATEPSTPNTEGAS